MKNIIVILILVPLSIFCQEKKTFNLLFNVGLAPAQIHGDSYSGFHKLGLIGGVGVDTKLNDKVSTSLLFWFIQKGAQKNQVPAKNDFTAYYVNLNYLEVPLLLTYTSKKYLFDIGISAAYLINYVEGTQNGDYTGVYPFRKFDYSVKVGLGYNISEKWFVNFRSSNSFITTRPNRIKQAIYYNNIIARTFNKGYYNNILEITLGFRLKSSKKNEQKT